MAQVKMGVSWSAQSFRLWVRRPQALELCSASGPAGKHPPGGREVGWVSNPICSGTCWVLLPAFYAPVGGRGAGSSEELLLAAVMPLVLSEPGRVVVA